MPIVKIGLAFYIGEITELSKRATKMHTVIGSNSLEAHEQNLFVNDLHVTYRWNSPINTNL